MCVTIGWLGGIGDVVGGAGGESSLKPATSSTQYCSSRYPVPVGCSRNAGKQLPSEGPSGSRSRGDFREQVDRVWYSVRQYYRVLAVAVQIQPFPSSRCPNGT